MLLTDFLMFIAAAVSQRPQSIGIFIRGRVGSDMCN